MRKLIAAINMTIDGYCDHNAVNPDEEIHQHYADLLRNADAAIYGRVTYQLMQYWQDLVKNPSGVQSMDDFAIVIDQIPKIVFSHTLKETGWESARLANREIDEYQLCIHPVIAGKGLQLFKNITRNQQLTLIKTKSFVSGAIVLYYRKRKQLSIPVPLNYLSRSVDSAWQWQKRTGEETIIIIAMELSGRLSVSPHSISPSSATAHPADSTRL